MNESKYIYLSHNVSNLVYHIVCPQVKKKLWGGQVWTDGYFVSTVGKSQNETVIREYVKNQGKQDTEYKQLYMFFRDIAKKDTP